MFFKSKQEKIKIKAQTLIADTERTLNEIMQSGEGTDKMLARLGISRQQALEAVLADDEIESCREDLRAAMLSQNWRIYGDGLNEDDHDRLWRTVRRWLPVLAEVVLIAKLNGYGVAHYEYTEKDENGFVDIKKIHNRQGSLDKFKPKTNGELHWDDKPLNTQVQFLFLVNRPIDTQPAGEMSAARLYPAVCIRKEGFIYAAQFIRRYAQPYLIAKNESNSDDEHRGFVQRLFGLINGGAMSVSREDEIQMLQNSADGSAFKRLENLANARIQKMLVGKVKTSDLESGSRAAQETEDKIRGERIDGYLQMLTEAVQHLLDAVYLVNLAWGKDISAKKGVWFEFNQEEQIDTTRAERDKIYLDSGLFVLTKDYVRDVLGFDEQHFVMLENAPLPSPLPKGEGTNGHDKTNAKKLSAKFSGSLNADKLPTTIEQVIMQPKIHAILSALGRCQSYAEFEKKLSKLDLSQSDNVLISRLVADGAHAWIFGDNENAA
ncbi:phage portal protein family protein [Wielerella bovis]|uniref:phage portal protein family protein n=1 Tax=Wielerella bovis TaxID=2917790 RepID=UPI002018A0F4|nr:DUF935 family protein [Wielerella bovis]MCG7655934.1 DUF935 family protein [Wielerella bovis]MCG7658149.1 DUF935 family protein [Wielerella bovis]MCG7660345.1 DUF935 family protein [Wielerella bovis]ULJ63276.1 DUF935 family protein [Wielerella bovis]